MKEYEKPEFTLINFATEQITNTGITSNGDDDSVIPE